MSAASRDRLGVVLGEIGPLAVAVSGGVDSLTLAAMAHRVLGHESALMVHAASPAVPGEATERVRAEAGRSGWSLRVVEAGEFADPNYRANPLNRCFFCKTNLYGTIRIEPETLAFIHRVETLVGAALGAVIDPKRAVRCRVRAAGIVVELDPNSLERLDADARAVLAARIGAENPKGLPDAPVRFMAYRTGSAFLTGSAA